MLEKERELATHQSAHNSGVRPCRALLRPGLAQGDALPRGQGQGRARSPPSTASPSAIRASWSSPWTTPSCRGSQAVHERAAANGVRRAGDRRAGADARARAAAVRASARCGPRRPASSTSGASRWRTRTRPASARRRAPGRSRGHLDRRTIGGGDPAGPPVASSRQATSSPAPGSRPTASPP